MNTPRAVPSGKPAQAMQAITKQKVHRLRAAIQRAVRNCSTAIVHASRMTSPPIPMNSQPKAAGGGGEDGVEGRLPETITIPIAT